MSPLPPAGYSGRSLKDKLGIRDGQRLHLVAAPPGFDETLGQIPEGVRRLGPSAQAIDIVLLFVRRRTDLENHLPRRLEKLAEGGMIWVAWPKKAAKVPTDVTESTVREVALPLGLVDVKVCAIDAVWSGLKLLRRRGRS